jgi:hypothetical protein
MSTTAILLLLNLMTNIGSIVMHRYFRLLYLAGHLNLCPDSSSFTKEVIFPFVYGTYFSHPNVFIVQLHVCRSIPLLSLISSNNRTSLPFYFKLGVPL